MKNIIFLLLLMGCFFTACEDIVDIELEEGSVEFVVDAWINTDTVPQVIKLRTTAPFFSNAFTPVVSGATVTITDQEGRIFSFVEEDASGNYVWTPEPGERFGTIGNDYFLEISLDDKTYTAFSQLNATVPVDSIITEFREESLGEPEGYYAEFFGRDNPGLGDAYWIRAFKNEIFLNKPQEINIAFDAGPSAGAEVDGIIFITPIREAINRVPDAGDDANDDSDNPPFELGDTIRVEILSITQEAFTYLERVRIQTTLGDAALFAEPPSNVPTNIISSETTENPQGFFVVSEMSSLEEIVE